MVSFSELVPILGLASTAFVAGLLWVFSACVMRSLDSIEPSQGLAAIKVINTDIITPIFGMLFFGSMAAGVAAMVISVGSLSTNGWMFVAGLIHVVGVMVVTATVHLPINAGFEALDDSPAALEEWKSSAARWTRFNNLRAGAAMAAAAAYAIHLALG